MADNKFEYDSDRQPEYRYGSSNRSKRQFAKRLLIGVGITEIVCGLLLIAFGAGASILGSKLNEMMWAPFVGGFLTIFVGMITIFVGFRKEKSALIFTAIVSMVNGITVAFLVIFAAAEALTRDAQCVPGSDGPNTCDQNTSGKAVAMDALLITSSMFVLVSNIIACIFCIRMALFTHHEDTPHVVVT